MYSKIYSVIIFIFNHGGNKGLPLLTRGSFIDRFHFSKRGRNTILWLDVGLSVIASPLLGTSHSSLAQIRLEQKQLFP